jgi:hypothetical protein
MHVKQAIPYLNVQPSYMKKNSRVRNKLTACEQENLLLFARCQQNCMTYTIAVHTVKSPDDGQKNFPKHVEFYSKNTFDKLVYLVGL